MIWDRAMATARLKILLHDQKCTLYLQSNTFIFKNFLDRMMNKHILR
jgi:hypothetical protein